MGTLRTSLVIAAGGRGTRFGGEQPKQYVLMQGRMVLAWSLRAFHGEVDEVVIAAAGPDQELLQEAIRQADMPCPVQVVPGGSTRLLSVAAGVRACTREYVLVHDAVRPLVSHEAIRACREAVQRHGAALLAVPCTSTVKRVGAELVEATVPRDPLWLAQTPQGFRRELAMPAYARALAEGWSCSDDAEVLERAGHRVRVVRGEASNIKITEPSDLPLALFLAQTCRSASTFPPGP